MTFSRVVFVHGAFEGSWCWERVLPLVEGDVVAVDLPGRPGSAPVAPTLENWADTVASATTGRSLVVAHSLGGISALAAANRAPNRIAGLMFVAGLVPSSGQCYWDLLPKFQNMIRKWMKVGEPVVRITRLAARLRLCNGLPPADRDMILSRLVPEPGLAMGTPVDYELADDLDLTYIHTTRDRMVRPSEQRHYVSVLPERTRRLTLNCGHSAHHAQPVELARIINDLL
jgi:esterase estC, putative